MSAAALALSLLLLAAVFATPAGRAGAVPMRGRSRRQLAGDALFIAAVAAQLAAPVLDLAGLAEPVDALTAAPAQLAGLALVGAATVLAVAAQRALGPAWSTSGEPAAGASLVTGGPFAHVRNPVYAGFIAAAAGVALAVPGPVSVAGPILLLAGLELLVRGVEEPSLERAHGAEYRRYAASTGRFLPRLGRCRRATDA